MGKSTQKSKVSATLNSPLFNRGLIMGLVIGIVATIGVAMTFDLFAQGRVKGSVSAPAEVKFGSSYSLTATVSSSDRPVILLARCYQNGNEVYANVANGGRKLTTPTTNQSFDMGLMGPTSIWTTVSAADCVAKLQYSQNGVYRDIATTNFKAVP